MKQRLVEVEPQAPRRHRGRRADRGRRQRLHRRRALAAVDRRRRHPDRRRRGRARADRAPAGVAGRARRRGGEEGCRTLAAAAKEDRNIMPASIACAQAGVTTGEWTETLRSVFGEYRAPTGVARAVGVTDGRPGSRAPRGRDGVARGSAGASRSWSASPASTAIPTAPSRSPCAPATAAWRWSTRASGSRPSAIVNAALEESVHVVGLSILSGAHMLAGRARSWPACARPASATCRSWSAASSRRPTPRR